MIIQSAKYFVGRLVPGLVNLLALSIYTRLLLPEDYGRYALVLTGVGLTNAIVFQWLNLSLLRFLPSLGDRLLPTGIRAFLLLMLGTSVLSIVAMAVTWDSAMPAMIGLMTVMTWSQAWFDFNLSVVNSRQFAIRHGLLSSLKAVIGLALSVILIRSGFGATGIVVGLSTAMLIASFGSGLRLREIRLRDAQPDVLGDLFRYGVPLSLTFVFSLLIDATNRFMLQHFHGATMVGAYAAPYDLTNQSLGVLLSAIHLAAYPALLQTFESKGESAALTRMSSIFNTLLLIALPACAFTILFPVNIAKVALGADFQISAVQLMPFIALIVSIWGFRSFYIDYAFLVKKKTLVQILPVLGSCVINAVLNLVLIPTYGIMGTVYSTLISVIIGTILAYLFGLRYLKYPSPGIDAVKIVIGVAVMSLVSALTISLEGARGLILQLIVAGSSYAIALIVMDAMGLRSRAIDAYTQFIANRTSTP
jgi:O-antigen/teichoic acid export membrane protein